MRNFSKQHSSSVLSDQLARGTHQQMRLTRCSAVYRGVGQCPCRSRRGKKTPKPTKQHYPEHRIIKRRYGLSERGACMKSYKATARRLQRSTAPLPLTVMAAKATLASTLLSFTTLSPPFLLYNFSSMTT